MTCDRNAVQLLAAPPVGDIPKGDNEPTSTSATADERAACLREQIAQRADELAWPDEAARDFAAIFERKVLADETAQEVSGVNDPLAALHEWRARRQVRDPGISIEGGMPNPRWSAARRGGAASSDRCQPRHFLAMTRL